MIGERRCVRCGEYSFSLDDAEGCELKIGGVEKYPERGKHYFDVYCPKCQQKQGLVISTFDIDEIIIRVIWPCSWNDEPCTKDGCEYCKGEYI